MPHNPCLCIILCSKGAYKKLPVRRLKHKEFPRSLLQDILEERIFLLIAVCPCQFYHLLLCLVYMLPCPLVHLVKPYPVVTALSPRTFRYGNDLCWLVLVKVFTGCHHINASVRMNSLYYIVKPFGSFKPPVPEQLCIIRRYHNAGLFGGL